MLIKRWITALVLIVFLFLIVLKGSQLLFTLFMAAAAALCLLEYFSIVSVSDQIPLKIKISAQITSLALVAGAHYGYPDLLLVLLACNTLFLSVLVLADFSGDKCTIDASARQVQALVYIPLVLALLVLLRNSENGALFVLWLWIIIGVSDTGAFYVGRNFGRHFLAPRVSPKKTVEGALGGLGAAVVSGVIFSLLFLPDISFFTAAVFALTAAAAGQTGDLFESAMKRSCSIKDSGKILPGHGGLLDRLDGLLFAVPIAYGFKVFIL
ncbi:MAG: phosphatidate cytidylyltransferase [Desulfobacteraceae bacterium]